MLAAFLLLTRGVISGTSDASEPAGYRLLSGIAVEAALAWSFHPYFAFEFDARTESREADLNNAPLGSIELLPMNLFVQFRPTTGGIRPYLGAGLNFTVAWEKTGALDDTRVTPRFGPAAQLGLDIELTERVLLNLDARYHVYRPDVIRDGATVASFKVDPLTLGAGLAVRL